MRAPALLSICIVAMLGCSDRHHPDNFNAGAVHGPALKQQTEDCRGCHGADLAGGDSNVSCDGCHAGPSPTAWRQNCTFCHGGVENNTGAPPRNLDGTDLIGPFPAHTAHITGSAIANAYDCVQCHTKANDVLSPGHVFDATPGEAENDYGAGLSPQAHFTRADGTCTNVYCHGTGRADDGNISARATTLPCTGCHPTQESGAAGWGNMSGPHSLHMASLTTISCADCHSTTTTDGTTIASKDLHINGQRDVAITAPSFDYKQATQTCTGTCHGYAHTNVIWTGQGASGKYHPAGFSAPTAHGTEMELQRQDCRGCHGATLTGGTGPSCDGCHSGASPTAWRTNCVFCHGGGIDQSGAPPRDLGSSILNTSQSFVAHPKHVTPTMMSANDCTTCHTKPTDVMSMNHAFDSTPMKAEVMLTLDGRNPAATYNGTGTCTNTYCHGNGQGTGNNGTYTDGLGPMTCTSCHGGKANNRVGLTVLHRDHHGGYDCIECHQLTAAAGGLTLANSALHINKIKEVKFVTQTITITAGKCTGPCHGTSHNNFTWQ
ncbi:MAG: cytochrome family protein [Myxococcales bacterium]|nr:cytochrome family protein [Myxococcales bacterium]